MRGPLAVAIASLASVAASSTTAGADEVVLVGAGPIRLAERRPRVVEGTTAVVRLEGGYRVGPRTSARVRIEALRADGTNLFADMVAELDVTPAFGVQGFAGLSVSAASGFGNHVGAGGFARWLADPALAVRADLFLSAALRNDFRGQGVGLIVGVEWRPRR